MSNMAYSQTAISQEIPNGITHIIYQNVQNRVPYIMDTNLATYTTTPLKKFGWRKKKFVGTTKMFG